MLVNMVWLIVRLLCEIVLCETMLFLCGDNYWWWLWCGFFWWLWIFDWCKCLMMQMVVFG